MGKSDIYLEKFYKNNIMPKKDVALLGFSEHKFGLYGDLYDKSLGNFEINSDWKLEKLYDTIICLRCAYFCSNPLEFIKKCHSYLNEGGFLYIDYGLGDHWRFDDYKVGWVKNDEHEYAYGKDNLLWSTIWGDELLGDYHVQIFSRRIKKLGYESLTTAIKEEVPKIVDLDDIRKYFKIKTECLSLWDDRPQLYIMLQGEKKHG